MEDMGDLEMDLESMIGGGGGVSGGEKTSQPTAEVLSVMEQSSRALQQMGLILMIAFMVSVLFMLLMATEIVYQEVTDWFSRRKEKSQEEKNPADLVGTFSRYK